MEQRIVDALVLATFQYREFDGGGLSGSELEALASEDSQVAVALAKANEWLAGNRAGPDSYVHGWDAWYEKYAGMRAPGTEPVV